MWPKERFRSNILNQVWWAIDSQSPVNHELSKSYFMNDEHRGAMFSKLKQLDANPEQVNLEFAEFGNLPIGKYFERLVLFALMNDNLYEIVGHNIQVKNGKITVGEADLLVKNNIKAEFEHWELSLKFYLQRVKEGSHILIGPNGKDRFSDKMSKLNDHQLSMGTHRQIKEMCGCIPIPRLFFKGMFFVEHGTQLHFEQKNDGAESGWWLSHDDLARLAEFEVDGWEILDKRHWIGLFSSSQSPSYSTAALCLDFQRNDHLNHRSICIVGMKNINGSWQETTRGFIVKTTEY